MKSIAGLQSSIKSKKTDNIFLKLYKNEPGESEKQKNRYLNALDRFSALFPESLEAEFFCTPGRTEIGGNHTDHNSGKVLAASVDLDVIAVVSKNFSNVITVKSEGHDIDILKTDHTGPLKEERFKSAALIRGICDGFRQLGYMVGGFNAYTTSDVLKGSGLSSSAAFEVLIATIINKMFCGSEVDDVKIAQIARYAENEYFGKPCGLMDQIACSVGGFVKIDFSMPDKPLVEKVGYYFSESEHSLVIVDTGGNHADLNEDYSALPTEMRSIAGFFGKRVLREIVLGDVLDNISELRKMGNDRAILRAIHFFDENVRVQSQYEALKRKDFTGFLKLVELSGDSSWKLCQNCYSCSDTRAQGITLSLALSRHLLGGKGACRVHGGGFAGTIQAFVPREITQHYIHKMNSFFGADACKELMIRETGSTCLEL